MSIIIDNIEYNLDNTNLTASVYANHSTQSNIIIPSSVVDSGKTYSVTSIESNSFNNCTSLISITLPDNISRIGNKAFYNCSALTGINIPNKVTQIEDSTFSGCNALISITLPDSVTSIGKMVFYNCYNLKDATLSNNITNINNGAFQYCFSLKNVNIPKCLTLIDDNAFDNCTSLTSVILPSSVTSIGNTVFNNCSSLINIVLPNSVISIGANILANCSDLINVTIPKSVTSMGGGTFSNCNSCIWVRLDCQESVFTINSSNTYGRTRIEKNNHIYYVLNGHTIDEINDISNPPTTPLFLNHNATIPKTILEQIIVTWGASTDKDGNSITYELYFYNGKDWVKIKEDINDLTYVHTIPSISYDTKSAKYKVRAYNGGLYSEFVESSSFELYGVINEPPELTVKIAFKD